MKKKMVGSMSDWSGLLKDLFRQFDDGSITLKQFKDFLEHKNFFNQIDALILNWQKFYQDEFGLKTNLSNLEIPEKQQGFDRLIIVAKSIRPQMVFNKCEESFVCWKYTNKSLDDTVVSNERNSKNGAYAIWVRNRVEADEKLKSKSADDIEELKISTETLTEHLLHELRYFKETGKHLDIDNVTLCAGSRFADGSVPLAHWNGSRLRVGSCDSACALGDLRSRQVVSLTF